MNKYPPFNYNNCVIVFAKDTFYLPSSGAKIGIVFFLSEK